MFLEGEVGGPIQLPRTAQDPSCRSRCGASAPCATAFALGYATSRPSIGAAAVFAAARGRPRSRCLLALARVLAPQAVVLGADQRHVLAAERTARFVPRQRDVVARSCGFVAANADELVPAAPGLGVLDR